MNYVKNNVILCYCISCIPYSTKFLRNVKISLINKLMLLQLVTCAKLCCNPAAHRLGYDCCVIPCPLLLHSMHYWLLVQHSLHNLGRLCGCYVYTVTSTLSATTHYCPFTLHTLATGSAYKPMVPFA